MRHFTATRSSLWSQFPCEPLCDIQRLTALTKRFCLASCYVTVHLLDVAKRAVEIAIEQDEAAGMAYIQEHTNGYSL